MTAPATATEPTKTVPDNVTTTKDPAPTEYIVLELVNGSWKPFATETARSAPAAIRAALEGNTDGGTFVAIPGRSWRPVKVTPQTTTTLKLEEAKS